MKLTAKIILIFALVLGSMLHSFADRGVRKKAKNKVMLNISSNSLSFKSSLNYNLKNGLKYKGFMLTETKPLPNFICLNGINSFQKGNTIYLSPYKQKIIIPELKQGYTGMKLIIKSRD